MRRASEESMAVDGEAVWDLVLRSALALPGVRVDRDAFLRKELGKYVTDEFVVAAIEHGPGRAGVPQAVVDEIANAVLASHKFRVSALSFAAGLPGGWWVAGTVPADLAQYFWHVVVVLQKLAYLYGWPEFIGEDEEVDEQTKLILTVFIGVMFGAQAANQAISKLSGAFAGEFVKRLPRNALTKYAVYRLAKEVAKWIGVKLTKEKFAQFIARGIPLLSGLISGTVTWVSFSTMSRRLYKHLQNLPIAGFQEA